jgi:hypothetical protein
MSSIFILKTFKVFHFNRQESYKETLCCHIINNICTSSSPDLVAIRLTGCNRCEVKHFLFMGSLKDVRGQGKTKKRLRILTI